MMPDAPESLDELETESRHPNTVDLDLLSPHQLVRRLVDLQSDPAQLAVREALAQVTAAVAAVISRLHRGGRLVYVGSGTSGRLLEADAAELAPTFGFDPARLLVVRPNFGNGGPTAANEDAATEGEALAAHHRLGPNDAVVALAASGRTPFTVAVAGAAMDRGSLTVGVAHNPGSPLAQRCELSVELLTGPEPIAGSTRMVAGLAQKLFLTTLSTAVMVGLGCTYSNLMTRTTSSISKLGERRIRTLETIGGLERRVAAALLEECDGNVEVAALLALRGMTEAQAREALDRHGTLRRALEA